MDIPRRILNKPHLSGPLYWEIHLVCTGCNSIEYNCRTVAPSKMLYVKIYVCPIRIKLKSQSRQWVV